VVRTSSMVPTPPIEPTVGLTTSTSCVMDMNVSSSAMSRMVTLVLGSPSFLANDLIASGVDLARVFRLTATLCERGNVVLQVARCVRVLMWVNLWHGMLLWNNS
jgi:hypothetical protein